MIVDMHCDTLSELREKKRAGSRESLRQNTLCLDLERMKKHGYLLQNFAVFVDLKHTEDPYEDALDQIRILHAELENSRDICGQVYSYNDIQNHIKQGKLSVMLSLEEGGMCGGDSEKLRALYEAGARMMTLCWNYENELGYPAVPEEGGSAKDSRVMGLKKKGIVFLEEMESLGMIPDVSHLSDQGFWDVVKYTEKPFVASHSNARALCPHSRNLTDEMIKAVGEAGGVIGLNQCPRFLYPGSNENRIEDLVAHLLHIRNVGGRECAALGSDFDGISGKLTLKGPQDYGKLTEALKKAGLSEDEIEEIYHKNVERVIRDAMW